MKLFCQSCFCLLLIILICACKSNSESPGQEVKTDSIVKEDSTIKTLQSPVVSKKTTIEHLYADTVWVHSYASLTWSDTLHYFNFDVEVEAWIDTTDYIVDTISSNISSSIAIGFNHYYSLHFIRGSASWFSLNFNKKTDLHQMLYGTDLWLQSNLDIVRNVLYNEKFDALIIELSVKTGEEFSNMFYMIAETKDMIRYIGCIRSWGGGDPDGEPFLTDDGRMYVTCDEIYSFVNHTAIGLAEYATMSLLLSGKNSTSPYGQLHALRCLQDNNFLVVFNRFHSKPKYNALILNTDSMIVDRFSYFGLIEDIDAVLLFEKPDGLGKAFLFDTEREVLITIETDSIPDIEETGLYEMVKVNEQSLITENYININFGFYGSYEFYISPADSLIYYRDDTIVK